jgi:hypothetical protein
MISASGRDLAKTISTGFFEQYGMEELLVQDVAHS